LFNGWLADAVGRRQTVTIACAIFTVGVIVQACTVNKDYVLAGRFVTGIGVGAFSMLVPLYNAELAPPEVRGALVALQQLAITFGIMVSYWIGYGTNFIGGTGDNQSDAAWLIPICIQLLPSTTLAIGMLVFMPQSPRHLMNKGKEEECLQTLARLRSTTTDDMKVRIEFLEIKAAREFDKARLVEKFPHYQDGSFKSNFMIGFYDYMSLVTNKSMFKRTMVAVLTMVFQQWNGVSASTLSHFIRMKLTLTTGQRYSLLCPIRKSLPSPQTLHRFPIPTCLFAGAVRQCTLGFPPDVFRRIRYHSHRSGFVNVILTWFSQYRSSTASV
jgi:MFS family permease